MDILSFAAILAAGFSGLAAHWYNRYAQGRTTSSFVEYLKANSKHTISSILSILATEIGMFSAAPVELTLSALFTAFTYGYTLDSIMNREGQKQPVDAVEETPTPEAQPTIAHRHKPKKSLQEIIDETREN
jgi:hypothetical protein